MGGIVNWLHLHGSLTHAGLVSQVELGDSETPADLLYLGEKAPVWGWGFRQQHVSTFWALKEDCSQAPL